MGAAAHLLAVVLRVLNAPYTGKNAMHAYLGSEIHGEGHQHHAVRREGLVSLALAQRLSLVLDHHDDVRKPLT